MKVGKQIIQIISNQFGVPVGQVTPESHFNNDLNLTPFEVADLILTLENTFQIKIEEEEAKKFQTVQDIINFVSDHLNEFTQV